MTVQAPTYSFLFPAYNAQATVARALDSVLGQTRADWELIAIDDGSTDATLELLRDYAAREERIFVLTQDNQGCAATRARAQKLARGRYLIKFDADDVLMPEYLERMDAFIARNPGYDLYSCNGYLTTYGPDGEVVSQLPYVAGPRFKAETELTLADIMEEPYLLGGGSAITRACVERCGGYEPGPRAEDFDMWVRAFLSGARHRYTPDMLYLYTKGIAGQMNDDQTISYASFIATIETALERDDLSREQRSLLEKGKQRYALRLSSDYYAMSSVNEELTRQSENYYAWLRSWLPKRAALSVFRISRVLKKPLDPLRIALARRKEKGRGRD